MGEGESGTKFLAKKEEEEKNRYNYNLI